MTRSDYQELTDFIGRQFAATNSRLTRVEVGVEENRHQIQILAEGITALRGEMDREFTAVRSEMAAGFTSVWSEFGTVRKEMADGFSAVRGEMASGFEVQGKLIKGIGARVDRLEVRLA